jgi:hypothetical protein
MRFINILTSIILLFTLSTNTVVAKEKTIKFHEPETEAERALDGILREQDDLDSYKPIHFDAVSTDTFALSYNEQMQKAGRILCPDEDDETCQFSCTLPRRCTPYAVTDIGFLYYTYTVEDNIQYIFTISKGCKSMNNGCPFDPKHVKTQFTKEEFLSEVSSSYSNGEKKVHIHKYTMKKEDDKWKLDGICICMAVNHKYCMYDMEKDIFRRSAILKLPETNLTPPT